MVEVAAEIGEEVVEAHMTVSAGDTVLELGVEASLGRWGCLRRPEDCTQLVVAPAVEEYAGLVDNHRLLCVVL